MTYTIIKKGSEMCVYLTSVDPPQYLTMDELSQWLRDTRDDNPDLYAELVKAYFELRKVSTSSKPANSSIVILPAISKKNKRS